MNYQAAPMEWYYENSQIRPLWSDDKGQLTFIVELPLVEDSVTGYRLETFPDMKTAGQWVRVVTHENLGYNERTGSVVTLTSCRGSYPTLCVKDLHYREGLPCERAILLGRSDHIKDCRVRFQEPVETTAIPT